MQLNKSWENHLVFSHKIHLYQFLPIFGNIVIMKMCINTVKFLNLKEKERREGPTRGDQSSYCSYRPGAKGQLPPPQMEGTTRDATANPNIGQTGRYPDCNMASSTRGANEERVHAAGVGPPAAETPPPRHCRPKGQGGTAQGCDRGELHTKHYARGNKRGGVRPPLPACATTAGREPRGRR